MRRQLAVVAVGWVVSACGGGSDPTQGTLSLQGLHTGTTSTGEEVSVIALDDASVWAVYGRTASAVFTVDGVILARGSAANGRYASTDARHYPALGLLSSGVLNATYTNAGALDGTFAPAVGTPIGLATTKSVAGYDYFLPASISDAVGTWTIGSLPDSTFTVASNGLVSGRLGSACSWSAVLAPRLGGRNVFDISITFGAGCRSPENRPSGVAWIVQPTGARAALTAVFVDALYGNGTAFVAYR